MKKAILLSLLFVACVFTASAQKFALIDMEYSCIRTGEYPTESSFTTISK